MTIKQIAQVIKDIGFCVVDESDTTLTCGSNVEKYDFGIAHMNEPQIHIELIDDKIIVKIPISKQRQKSFVKSFHNHDDFVSWFKENYPKVVKLTSCKRISLLRLARFDRLGSLVKYLGEGILE